MDVTRETWIAAVRLASMISVIAALATIAATSLGDVSAIAIAVPIVVTAFVTSWVQTGRIRRMAPAPLLTGR